MMTKPFYWSVRREVWENRSVLIVPASAAVLFLVAFALNLPGLASAAPNIRPYRMVCFLLTMASLLTGIFYSLDALHGERRDRSILFWKSMPVSDRVAVLAKAFIPLILLPVVTLAAGFAAQIVMLLLSAGMLLASGGSMASLGELPLLHQWSDFIFGIAVLAVWQAPIHGWLLLVSGWARKAVMLWALLLPLALSLFEHFAFGTDYLGGFLLNRLTAGIVGDGLIVTARLAGLSTMDKIVMLSPGTLAADPNLWLGLIPTILLLAGAVAARRYRAPI